MYPDLVHNRDCGVGGIDPNRSSVGQFLQWREMQRENARQTAVGTRFGFGLRHSELSEPQKQARAVLYLVWFAVVFLCYYGYLQTPGAQAGTATHLSATSATSTGVLAVDLTPTATDPNSNNTTIGPTAPAAPVNPSDPAISLNINGGDRSPSTAVLVFILITVMSVAPSLLLMMTSFTKIFIVLAMTRNALGLNQIPPTQVISGLALFLSLFIMMPTVTEIYDVAAKPYMDGKLPNFTAALQADSRLYGAADTRRRHRFDDAGRRPGKPGFTGGHAFHHPSAGLHDFRGAFRLHHRLRHLHTFPGDRPGGRGGADVDGYDDAASRDDFAAFQGAALRDGRRLGPVDRDSDRDVSMNAAAVLDLALTAMVMGAKLAAPILVTSLVVGFLISLFQSITQIQEITLTFVPKTIAVAVVLYIAGYWMLQTLVNTTTDLVARIPALLNS